MKTIGLIGGMSRESSIEYYRIINEGVQARLGGLHSTKSVMVSADFAEIESLQHQGLWEQATQIMIHAAQDVEQGGADCVVICTNTMHKMAEAVQAQIHIPLLHIADATAAAHPGGRLAACRAAGEALHHGGGFLQGATGSDASDCRCSSRIQRRARSSTG